MADRAHLEGGRGSARPYPVAASRGASVWSVVSRSRFVLPAIVIAGFLAAWQYLPETFGIPTYELPNLSATLTGLHDDWSQIGTSLLITLQDAMAGFILGNLLAILGAVSFSYSRTLERAFFPVAILIQNIPILVFAPLLVILFLQVPVLSGAPDAAAVICVVILITFFPTLVNMTAGLKAVDPRTYELLRLLNASKTQILIKLRFPSSLPFLFTSLRITSTLAFVGALVGEYMVGGGFNPIGQFLSNHGRPNILGFDTSPIGASGIGFQLQVFYSRLDKPGVFADVFVVCLLSILFFGLMVLLERLVVPWRAEE
jgi:NitT/TauT family transport system permease protein